MAFLWNPVPPDAGTSKHAVESAARSLGRTESRVGIVSQVAILLSFLFGLQRRHGPPLADEILERSESTYNDHEPREHHLGPPPRLRQASETSSMRRGNKVVNVCLWLQCRLWTATGARAGQRAELRRMHEWLDFWSGLGLIVAGMTLRDRRARLEVIVAGSELMFPVRRLVPDGLSQSPDRPGGRGGGLEAQTHCWATVTPPPCRW